MPRARRSKQHGDRVNAAHARYLEVRRLLLIGRIDEAERTLARLDPGPFPPASRTAHELVVAGIAMRRLRTKEARDALARARRAAQYARIPALTAEVESARLALTTPAARLIASGEERLLLLEEVEALFASKAFVVDACRYVVRHAGHGGLARQASGAVRARARARRSVAGRRREGHARRARLRIEVRRRVASRAAARRNGAAAQSASDAGRGERDAGADSR